MLRSASWLVAAVLVSAVAGTGRADFVLSGSEHLNVNLAHDIGILYDSSTANVVSGGNVSLFDVNDEALLRVVSGEVHNLRLYDNSNVDISGGDVGALSAYSNSSIHMSTGSIVWRLDAYDSTSVDIFGGTIDLLYAWNENPVAISGGTIRKASFRGNSTAEVSGGIFDNLDAIWDSTTTISGGEFSAGVNMGSSGTMDIFGGSIPSLSASDGIVTFHGYDFRGSGGLSLEDEWVVGTGWLTGKWSDGTAWITRVDVNSGPWATIRLNVVPEPSTLAMLLCGLLAITCYWKRRRG